MHQVDLKLAGAALLGNAIDLKPLCLGKIIDVVNDRPKFIDGRH